MKGGLEKTFELLASTNNEAATALLLANLDATDRNLQNDALRALVRRRSAAGHRELIRRWDTLSERFKETICELSSRMSGALRDAILSTDDQLAENGLDAVLRLREYDLIPPLLTAAEDKTNPRAKKAARAVLALCEMLAEELTAPTHKTSRRDPQRTRQFLMASLESSAARFDQHRNNDVLEAFLLLATAGNATLRRFLQNPHAKAYLPTVNLLGQSTRPGLQELLLSFLEDPHPPNTIASILSKRQDVQFLRGFFRRFTPSPPGKRVARNLKRIESFSWLQEDLPVLKALSEEEEQGAVQLVTASGVNRLAAFEVIKYMLAQGGVPARRAASSALQEFHGADANQLVVNALEDPDSDVRANVIRQLRDRGIPNAMQRLLELVMSPDPKVSEAARDSLAEFSFERFLASYDLLEEDVARNTGTLVRKIDGEAIAKLNREFDTRSRSRRLRAVAVTVAMGAVRDVETKVVEMLSDPDHYLRASAAEALVNCDSASARQALRELLLDRSPSVREAAERTLQSFAEAATSAGPLDFPAPLDEPFTAFPPSQENTP